MLTTQFSGCSFCLQQSGGKVYAAHISPDEARTKQDPIALAEGLQGTGAAAGGAFKGSAAPDSPCTAVARPTCRGCGLRKGAESHVDHRRKEQDRDVGGVLSARRHGQGSKPKVYRIL